MISFDTNVRVRYAETDKMGYVYYGIYAEYFEVGRTELMRHYGLPYSYIEENGIMLPVLSMNVKYIKPAFYDQLLTVRTFLKEVPAARIKFDYEMYNEQNVLLNIADITLVFIDALTRKPRKSPDSFIQRIEQDFYQNK